MVVEASAECFPASEQRSDKQTSWNGRILILLTKSPPLSAETAPQSATHVRFIMVENVFEKLCSLFETEGARFRVMHHQAGGKSSQSVAEIRGTELGQGAKALCCTVKGNGVKKHVLAVLPADRQADLSRLAASIGGRRASLASPEEVTEFTGCVFGAVPPVSFHPELELLADRSLFKRYEEIAFNAGRLDASIIINTEDYRRIAHPLEVDFLKDAE